MNLPEEGFGFHERSISLEMKIMNLFQGVWTDYLMSVHRKSNSISDIKKVLYFLFQKLKELDKDSSIFSFVFDDDYLVIKDGAGVKERLPENDHFDVSLNEQKDSQYITILKKHKSSLAVSDYLILSACLSENISKALLMLQTVLSIDPTNTFAYFSYNFFKATKDDQILHFYEALTKFPAKYCHKSDTTSFFEFIKSLHQVINSDVWIHSSDFVSLLRFLGVNRVVLMDLLRTLNQKFSSQNILELLPHAIKQNPYEKELQGLRVVMLYKSKRYEEAYRIIKQIDIFSFTLKEEQFLELQFIYSFLLNRNNQIGEALIELESIIENEDYKGILTDDYFNACFLLVEIYCKIGYFDDAADIYSDILDQHKNYMIEYDAYTYFALKGDVYSGLKSIDKALDYYLKAAEINKSEEIVRKINLYTNNDPGDYK